MYSIRLKKILNNIEPTSNEKRPDSRKSDTTRTTLHSVYARTPISIYMSHTTQCNPKKRGVPTFPARPAPTKADRARALKRQTRASRAHLTCTPAMYAHTYTRKIYAHAGSTCCRLPLGL